MNKSFITRQYIDRVSVSTSRQNKINKKLTSAKMCRDAIEKACAYQCKDCRDNRLYCYCLAA